MRRERPVTRLGDALTDGTYGDSGGIFRLLLEIDYIIIIQRAAVLYSRYMKKKNCVWREMVK